MKLDLELLKRKINNIKIIWEKELMPFVLAELIKFDTVRDFVLSKIV